MTTVLIAGAALCVAWALVSAILLTIELDRRGMPTPFPWIGALLFRNLGRYREVTARETGKVGPLFLTFVIPINAAWVLALLAWVVQQSNR